MTHWHCGYVFVKSIYLGFYFNKLIS